VHQGQREISCEVAKGRVRSRWNAGKKDYVIKKGSFFFKRPGSERPRRNDECIKGRTDFASCTSAGNLGEIVERPAKKKIVAVRNSEGLNRGRKRNHGGIDVQTIVLEKTKKGYGWVVFDQEEREQALLSSKVGFLAWPTRGEGGGISWSKV